MTGSAASKKQPTFEQFSLANILLSIGAGDPVAARTLGRGGGRGTHRPTEQISRLARQPAASLEGSRLAEKLDAIAGLDLDELQAADAPRGYGRD
jgi:hypothetical protein